MTHIQYNIDNVLVLGVPQSSSQFMRHAKRRKLTVEDFNRALRWSNVEVSVLSLLSSVKRCEHDLQLLNFCLMS